MISGRKNIARVRQGVHDNKTHTPAQELEDLILRKANVHCTATIDDNNITLRTESYIDFVLAKSVIRGANSLEVVRA